MNRTQQLKLLNKEIRRLFFEGITESDAYDQLQSDPRFDSVRRASIQSLYKKLQKDADKQAKVNELNEQKRYRQNAENLLLCEKQLINKEGEFFKGIWKDRYFLISFYTTDRVRKYKVTDLYQNVSKEASLLVDGAVYVAFYPLNGQFGLVVIWHRMNDSFSFHLIYIDLVDGKLELVQEIKRDEHRSPHVFVDSLDRSKFVLAYFVDQRFSVIACSLSKGKVNVGEEVVLVENYDLIFGNLSYFSNQLFGLKFDDEHDDDVNYASFVVQDLAGEKRRNTLKLEPLPSNVQVRPLRSPYVWICDHVFIPIRFVSTELCGIAFTDLQTRKWSILEFTINLPITNMTRGDNCTLLIHAGKLEKDYDFDCDEVSAVYKLPIRKPESLRYKAWLKTIEFFKNKKVANPYKEARRFLPFNSEIHTPFTVNESKNDGQE